MRGKRTTVDHVDVEIDTDQVLQKIYAHFIPQGMNFINEDDGFWYKVDGHDYHRNEELYEKARQATEEELEFHKANRLIRKFVLEHTL
jgi:hypothetical protein